MMKAIRCARMALPAAVAAVAMVPAAPASAAAKHLVLKASGTAVANGSAAAVSAELGECAIISNGTVVANEATKDVLSGATSSNAECPSVGESISGLITETQLGKTGKAKLTGSLTISLPGSCSYSFKNPKGTFAVPGFALIEGKTKGKLVKGSSKSCAKTDERELHVSVTNEPFGEPFADEVA